MLKLLRSILIVSFLIIGSAIQAQHLSITNIGGGIPLQGPPNDTAYEDTASYNISIDVFNSDSVTFIDTLDIFIKANNHTPDYLYFGTGIDSIGALSMITLNPPNGYHFSQTNFDDGDNIVVIWPAARNTPGIGDSIVTIVYFQSLNGIDEYGKDPVRIFPNPSADFVYLDGLDKIKVKCVRITDISGKEYYTGIPASNMIPIRYLAKGTYLISIEESNGNRRTIKLFKS